MGKRKHIPRMMKDSVHQRQKGKCAICIERGVQFHHVDPVALSGKNTAGNLVFLCLLCHKKLHLADPDTCMAVYEYVYLIQNGELPDDPYGLMTAEGVLDKIKEDYIEDIDDV